MQKPAQHPARGAWYGAAAYGLWGVFPLYFLLLAPAGAIEILVHRVVWSLLVCLVVLATTGGWSALRPVTRAPGWHRRVGLLAVAATVIALNWGVYIFGVITGQVVETALGYFINPLVTVLLGVLVLRERLRALQWAAVAMGAVAVGVLTLDYGRVPWIALILAFSFATYGLVKNRVGRQVGALASMTTETALLFPFAIATLGWLQASGRGTFTASAPHALLLASTGIATTVPLLLFAAAARRIPLTAIGLLQFLTPVLQFCCGVFLLHERVPPSRWVGFSLVWLALVVLTVDSLRSAATRSRATRKVQVLV